MTRALTDSPGPARRPALEGRGARPRSPTRSPSNTATRPTVIAWSPDDRLTAAQIERVIDAFEKTAWAGLAPDRYAWLAVLHRDRGSGVHVHVFRGALRPGDRAEPEHRPAGLAEDVRPAARRLQLRAWLEAGRTTRLARGRRGRARPGRIRTRRRYGPGWTSSRTRAS